MEDTNKNTGGRNTGIQNTGHWNAGSWNTGSRNTGDWNTGGRNTGSRNTGDWNTGSQNTGYQNTGDWNTGDHNTGDQNTGDWNTGDQNAGFFCTETPSLSFFDKPTNLTWEQAIELIPYVELSIGAVFIHSDAMTDKEKLAHPEHEVIGGYLKNYNLKLQEAFPLAWKKMSDEEKAKWLALPNFNAEKFLKCTGVDVRPQSKPKIATAKVRLSDGTVVEGEVVAD
jgi:hypothetical protein